MTIKLNFICNKTKNLICCFIKILQTGWWYFLIDEGICIRTCTMLLPVLFLFVDHVNDWKPLIIVSCSLQLRLDYTKSSNIQIDQVRRGKKPPENPPQVVIFKVCGSEKNSHISIKYIQDLNSVIQIYSTW